MREIKDAEIYVTNSGYEQDWGSHRLVWDNAGKYIGQWQPDMLSDEPGCGDIFLKEHPDCSVPNLTANQMSAAKLIKL